jgi:hypothetical protein
MILTTHDRFCLAIMTYWVLDDVYDILLEAGTDFRFALANYPKNPRKMGLSEEQLVKYLENFGFYVDKLPSSTLLYRLRI